MRRREKASGSASRSSEGTGVSPAGEEWIYVGRIAGAFGVRGEVKVVPDTDFPSRFNPGSRLYAGLEHLPLVVRRRHQHAGMLLLSFEGRPDRNSIEELRRLELYAAEEAAEALPQDHFRVRDLLGCVVSTTEGTELGTLREVLRTGSNDVYVVRGEREVLLPAIPEVVREVDLAARRIVVTPLPGLLS